MPQVQILQAQPDPGAAAIRSAGELINDSIYKKQQLEVMKQDLIVKSKMSQTEEDKLKLERQRIFLDSMQKAMDQGVFKNERLAQAWMGMMGKSFGKETFEFMAEAGDALKGFQSPEAEAKSAAAQESAANAGYKDALSGLISANTPTAANRAGALSGQQPSLELSQIGPSGPTFENTALASRKVREDATIREQVKMDSELAPTRRTFDNMKQLFSGAVQELGGLGESGIAASGVGAKAAFMGNLGKAPTVRAFSGVREQTALQIASFVNRGRPSDPDKESVLKALPDLGLPKATNELLFAYWDKVLSMNPNDPVGPGPIVQQMNSVIEGDKKVMTQLKKDYPNAKPEEINSMLEAIHASMQGGQ